MEDDLVSDLVRTKGGSIVHRRDCAALGGGVCSTAQPWHWAEGRTVIEVRYAVGMVGSTLCRRCNPLGGGEKPLEVNLVQLPDPQSVRVATSDRHLVLESNARSVRGAQREVTGMLLKRGYRPVTNWRDALDSRGVTSGSTRLFLKKSH